VGDGISNCIWRGGDDLMVFGTYVYTAWQAICRKQEVEVELISARIEPPIAAKDLLILK